MAVYELNVSHPLLLRQSVSTNIKVESVVHTLPLTHEVVSSPKVVAVSSTLALRHSTNVHYGVYNGAVASTLVLSHKAQPRVHFVDVHSYLNFAHQAIVPKEFHVQHTLNITHSAVRSFGQYPASNLILSQTVVVHVVRALNVVSTLNLSDVAGVYLRRVNFIQLPSSQVPILPVDNKVRFTFAALSVELPRPELENGLRLDFTRINRRTRGGDLVVFADSAWPKTKTLTLRFMFYGETKAENVRSFLKQTLGKQVQYEDHYGATWQGLIMTPAAEIVQENRFLKSVALEFQGMRI